MASIMEHQEAIALFGNYLMDHHNDSENIFIDLDAYLRQNGYTLSCVQQGIRGTILSVEKQEKS